MPRHADVPAYDEKEVERLMGEEGYSWAQAIREAATTMDGAWEGAGGINSKQTACHELHYQEGGRAPVNVQRDPRHKAADKGADDTEKWLAQNDPNYGKNVSRWSGGKQEKSSRSGKR